MTRDPNDWQRVEDARPPDGQVVMTRIDDGRGIRNETALRLRGGLWWFPDGSMYVYYTPTHWRPAP